ncbi:MAG: hypothetical protein ACRDIA_00275, partial [Actinomycetota bacterium]
LRETAVGLYEFLWLLKPEGVVDEEEALEISTRSLERLLSSPGRRLVVLKWPPREILRTLSFEEVRPSHWRPPEEHGEYVAIVST